MFRFTEQLYVFDLYILTESEHAIVAQIDNKVFFVRITHIVCIRNPLS